MKRGLYLNIPSQEHRKTALEHHRWMEEHRPESTQEHHKNIYQHRCMFMGLKMRAVLVS